MCRLFLRIGKEVNEQVYSEFIGSCSDYVGGAKLDVHERNETKLEQHSDGFGYGYVKDDHFELRRFREPIYERNPVDEWKKIETDVLFIHARKAPPNITVNIKNNHPFYWYNGDEYVFGHNGTIKNKINEYDDRKFFLKGSTDSEKYFYSLLTAMAEKEWAPDKQMIDKLLENWDYTSANFILASPKKAWVGVFYRKDPLYFTMKLYKTDDSIVVSSSAIPSLGSPTERLRHGSLVEIDIASNNYYYLSEFRF
ncbi:MAG: hypothetical protein GOP50_02345 [Candidatus Heimdallarchaeota archaeon]|nr:hypothetical protein [Candidatus Heimdallarchaeota archaeon]